jgi:hypothetical protein
MTENKFTQILPKTRQNLVHKAYSANMDDIQRLLPIISVILFAIMLSIFQTTGRPYQNTLPSGYFYKASQIDDNGINQVQSKNEPNLKVDPWWGMAVLFVPTVYWVKAKFDELRGASSEPVGRGYSIAYQDIRRTKKRTFKSSRKTNSTNNKST